MFIEKKPQDKIPKHIAELMIMSFGLNWSFQFLTTMKTSCIYLYQYKFQNHLGQNVYDLLVHMVSWYLYKMQNKKLHILWICKCVAEKYKTCTGIANSQIHNRVYFWQRGKELYMGRRQGILTVMFSS